MFLEKVIFSEASFLIATQRYGNQFYGRKQDSEKYTKPLEGDIQIYYMYMVGYYLHWGVTKCTILPYTILQ